MSLHAPVLLFQAQTERRPYVRRTVFLSLAFLASLVAFYTFFTVRRGEAGLPEEDLQRLDPLLLDIGQGVALIAGGLLLIRLIFAVRNLLTLTDERVRVFDQGFVWERDGELHRYNWSKVKTYRRGARVAHIFGKPIIKRGAHTLTMVDGRQFAFTGRLGDPRRFNYAIEPMVADTTASRISEALRNQRGVKLSKNLAVAPAGIIAGQNKIGWKSADVIVKRDRLIVRRINGDGKLSTVYSKHVRHVDNVAGFMDVAEVVIEQRRSRSRSR